MSTKRPLELTPEQLAKQEARRLKKLLKEQAGSVETPETKRSAIVHRPWLNVTSESPPEGQRIKVLTWNLLAQCLVRRKLFPTSDCLKAKEREGMTFSEMFTHNPDIMCLQETDRLESILPALEKESYAHHYAAGPRKLHGCLIAFKKDLYTLVGQRLVQYDNEDVREIGEENTRRGASFRTKNIGSIVALQDAKNAGRGVIVATTHLFWHPRYNYERARQASILKRTVLEYRAHKGLDHWPCIVAGDFNFAPDDPAYALLVGDDLHPGHDDLIKSSHVVHMSIDPTVPKSAPPPTAQSDGDDKAEETIGTTDGEGDEAAEEEATDPRMPITSARKAALIDGLLSSQELEESFRSSGGPLRSAYDVGMRNITDRGRTFGDRLNLPSSRLGAFEPEWTSYTFYWKTVLDYIFIIEPKDTTLAPVVTGLLQPHKTKTLELGLPQSGICGSDHVSLCAEIVFPRDAAA